MSVTATVAPRKTRSEMFIEPEKLYSTICPLSLISIVDWLGEFEVQTPLLL